MQSDKELAKANRIGSIVVVTQLVNQKLANDSWGTAVLKSYSRNGVDQTLQPE
jgi:hypothetical protein